ncbi:hypothetical protein V2I01_35200 [Micromonospora sp. BRA006-A]|nr:hypothetical protein [Micromonospora sp. BRA006-A]
MSVDGRPLADPARLRGIRVAARLDRPAQCELTLTAAPGRARSTRRYAPAPQSTSASTGTRRRCSPAR